MISLIEIYRRLNEEFLGSYLHDHNYHELYKNPKSIKNISNRSRAISSKRGDIYILDDGGKYLVHGDLAELLSIHGILSVPSSQMFSHHDKFIPWTLSSGAFYLSESFWDEYAEAENYYKGKKILKNVIKKNPNLRFKLKVLEY